MESLRFFYPCCTGLPWCRCFYFSHYLSCSKGEVNLRVCKWRAVTNPSPTSFRKRTSAGFETKTSGTDYKSPHVSSNKIRMLGPLSFFRGSVLEALLRGQVSGFLCVPLCHVLSVVRTEKLLWKSQQTMDLSSINSSYSGITLEKTSGI